MVYIFFDTLAQEKVLPHLYFQGHVYLKKSLALSFMLILSLMTLKFKEIELNKVQGTRDFPKNN